MENLRFVFYLNMDGFFLKGIASDKYLEISRDIY